MARGLGIIRPHTSPYFPADFGYQEQAALQSLPGVRVMPLEQWQTASDLVLITDTHVQLSTLPAALLEKVRLILHPNSGHDNFANPWPDLISAPIVLGNSLRAQAVAEFCWARLWQGLIRVPVHLAWDPQRHWDRPQLAGTRILIVGAGQIGTILKNWLTPFRFNLEIFDPFQRPTLPPSLENIRLEFQQLLETHRPQVIILACSLNPSSQHLLKQQTLQLLPPEVVIINAARGALIDQKALLNFLETHPRALTFLDVFEKEPAALAELSTYENLHCTSHIAGVSANLAQRTIKWEAAILKDYLSFSADKFKRTYGAQFLSGRMIRLPSGESFLL